MISWGICIGICEGSSLLAMCNMVIWLSLFPLEYYSRAARPRRAARRLLSIESVAGCDFPNTRRAVLVQANLANTYGKFGQHEKALQMKRDVYSGRLRLNGEEDGATLAAACNYASTLHDLQHFEEAKSVICKMMPVARRTLGDSHLYTIQMRTQYARASFYPGATLDDLREAVTRLEETLRISRRVLGRAHPTTDWVETTLGTARGVRNAALVQNFEGMLNETK